MSSDEWVAKTLGDLVTFQRGYDLPKNDFAFGEYPVAGSNGIIGYHDEFTTEGPSITIGRSGNLGTPFYYEHNFWAHNTTLFVKEFHNTDPKFIYYLLKTVNFSQFNSGSAVPSLNRNYIHPLEVVVPKSIQTQRSIAEILSALDDKIELNRRTNATLEAIARAIFKEWFVDFNYPGATDEMVQSELGMIPKAWRIGKLEDFVKISSGKGLQKNEFVEKGYPVLGANGSIGYAEKYLFDEEVIITGRVGTLGTFQLLNEKVWISDNVLILRSIKKENYYFSYFWIKTIDFRNLNRGSTQPLVTKTDLLNQRLLIPDSSTLLIFDNFCRALFAQIEHNKQLSSTITGIRDILLPKLMSGEILV